MIRALLRKLGFRVHRGWRPTHRSGYDIECVGCGEKRTAYQRPWDWRTSWWETTASGDGSCGPIRELP